MCSRGAAQPVQRRAVRNRVRVAHKICQVPTSHALLDYAAVYVIEYAAPVARVAKQARRRRLAVCKL